MINRGGRVETINMYYKGKGEKKGRGKNLDESRFEVLSYRMKVLYHGWQTANTQTQEGEKCEWFFMQILPRPKPPSEP